MQAASGVQQGQQRGREESLQNSMAMFNLMRQQRLDEQQSQLTAANMAHLGAETTALGRPRPTDYEIRTDPTTGETYRIDKGANTASRVMMDGGTDASGRAATSVPSGALTLHPLPQNPRIGDPAWLKAQEEAARIRQRFAAPPNPQFSVQPGAPGMPAQGVVFDPRTRTATTVPLPDVSKSGSGMGSAQTAPQLAAAKANLESAMKVIDDYDAKRLAGLANYTTTEATKGAVGSAPAAMTAPPGLLGPIESLIANTAGQNLNANNPDLAGYLTAKKFVAEAILNTHKRPNQTQYEIEQELSAPGVDASPFQIQLAKSRRQKMYHEVFGGDAGTLGPPPVGGDVYAKYGLVKPQTP